LRLYLSFHPLLRAQALSLLLTSFVLSFSQAQQAPQKPAEKPLTNATTPTEPQNPAQFELLETRYRFEANGDSRKEVHARVHINSELGVHQFARLNFDYSRSFQSIEIPLVHITHPSGGTADILPSAITDNPNPAVVNAPAYQDVRVKSVRILGLEPGDNLEYRVITTTTHHPLAPDFWLDHSFDRTGVVTQEIFELDLPASRQVQIHNNPATPATSTEKSGEGDAARSIYRWNKDKFSDSSPPVPSNAKDVALTTYQHWATLSDPIGKLLEPSSEAAKSVSGKAKEIARSLSSGEERLKALYNFVAHKITTVELPVGSTGFRTRQPDEILASGYATPEDKFALLYGLADAIGVETRAALFGARSRISGELPAPSLLIDCAILVHIFLPPENLGHGLSKVCDHCGNDYWLVPSMEVAPFAVLPSTIRGKQALIPHYMFEIATFADAPTELPFPSTQLVHVDATLSADGKLAAKVHYALRGDNELLLRVGFHQTPKDKWKELAQLLSLSDGFRGQVTSVNASDPYATREPFTVDYEIVQPKFVDWSKKPVRIPALLPQLGLPDPPAKPALGAATAPIELGTPLEVETHMTLHLPPRTTPHAPTGTSVQRDYATFASQYSAIGLTVTAFRHIHFLSRQVPADRAADYNAFLRAVLNDQAQDFTLDHESPRAPAAKPAASASTVTPTPKP
jgi:uncharacterized protein DUF3857